MIDRFRGEALAAGSGPPAQERPTEGKGRPVGQRLGAVMPVLTAPLVVAVGVGLAVRGLSRVGTVRELDATDVPVLPYVGLVEFTGSGYRACCWLPGFDTI